MQRRAEEEGFRQRESSSGPRRMPDGKPKRRTKDESSRRPIARVYRKESGFRSELDQARKESLRRLNVHRNDKMRRLLERFQTHGQTTAFMLAERSVIVIGVAVMAFWFFGVAGTGSEEDRLVGNSRQKDN